MNCRSIALFSLSLFLLIQDAGGQVASGGHTGKEIIRASEGSQYPPVRRTLPGSRKTLKDILSDVFSFLKNKSDAAAEEKEGPRFDRPDLAWEQEFRLTKDPVLNSVPRERLIPVMEQIRQQRTQRGVQPSAGLAATATWVERGPSNVAGRTRALMFDPNDATKKKVWAGGVGGGLWYTNDITAASPVWINVGDLWANMSVTTISYNPANTQEFYVGTGEGWGNVDAIRGAGIWKTSNGGATWTQLSSTSTNSNFDYVNKIIVNSTGVVFAATSSRYCNNGGVYKSTNGGTSWALSFGTQGSTCAGSNCSAADVEVGTDGTIYASTGIFYSGGIYKSTDVGATWTQINTGTNGFPNTGISRIEIATAPSDANRLYAMVENLSTSGLLNIYTSTNKGSTWTTCTKPAWFDQSCTSSSTDMTRQQAWYDLILAVDPLNAANVIAGGVDLMKSSNSGTSWTQISSWCDCCSRPYVHADQHAFVFQPGSSTTAISGNDGGISYTSNLTAATPAFVTKNTGYNVTQFYSCAIHPTAGTNYFLAGAQDNGTQQFTGPGINTTTDVNGGDGAFCFIDQVSPTYEIASYVYNNYYRSTNNWGSSTTLSSSNTGDFINPADYDDVNHILYSAYSTSQIQRISGVTGTPATTQLTITGMTTLPSHLRVSPYAPAGSSTVYVGTQDAKLYKVTNAQATPTITSIGSASFPVDASISCVEIGANENDLLVTFYNYGVVSVWRTTDGGATWSNKEGNLPDMPVRWAIYNPNNRNEVLLATEVGVWSTADITVSSPSWVANNNGLANVRVDMFQMRNSDKELLAATHGRGLFSTNVFGAPPLAAFSASSTSACTNNDIVFTSSSTGAITSWSWNFGSGAIPATSTSAGPVTVQYTTGGSKTITLTVTGPNGTNTLTKTSYVTVTSGLGVIGTITGSTTACSGQSGRIYSIAAVSGASTYTWSVPSGASINSGQGTNNIQATFAVSGGNVSVYASNATCNSSIATKSVSVVPGVQPPVISPSGTIQYCTGDLVQLTAAQPAVSCGTASSSVCNGTTSIYTAGSGTGSNTSTTYPTPYGNYYEATRNQFLFRQSELSAAGLRAGTITSLSFDVTALNAGGTLKNYTIRILCTSSTTISTFQSGAVTVYGPVNYTPVLGLNTHTLTAPFNWNGTSNLIVEICHNNDAGSGSIDYTYNAGVKYSAAGFTSSVYRYVDNNGDQCSVSTVSGTSANRPNIGFGGCGGNTAPAYLWSNGGTTSTINVTSSGNYTVIATSGNGCSETQSKNIAPKPGPSTSIRLFIQGFYLAANMMSPTLYINGLTSDSTACDSVTVLLRSASAPYSVIHSIPALLKTNGYITCSPSCTALNQNYYIVIRSRNGIETWSKNPVTMNSTTVFRFDL